MAFLLWHITKKVVTIGTCKCKELGCRGAYQKQQNGFEYHTSVGELP